MKPHYYLCLVALLFSCSKESDPEPIPMSVTTGDAVLLSSDKVKLTGVIKNYVAGEVGEVGFYVTMPPYNYGNFSIPSTSSAEFEVVLEGLPPLKTFTYTAYFKKTSNGSPGFLIDAPSSKTFETGFPTVSSVTPTTTKVTDFTTVTVNGSGFGDGIVFYFGSKASPTSAIEYMPFTNTTTTATQFSGRVPAIGARGKDTPAFFTGPIQPTGIYMGNESKTLIQKVADFDYTYLFSLASHTGVVDGTFSTTIYYGQPSPALDNIEVYFGDTKVSILEKKFVQDIAIGNQWIEGHILKCQIPAGATVSTTYKIRVVSPFGEEFIPNAGGDQLTIN